MRASFRVRAAVDDDVDALVDLIAAVVAEEGRWMGAEPPLDREDQRRRLADRAGGDGSSGALVAVADGSGPVGYLGIDLAPYGVASLVMAVDAGWRRRGVGRALVAGAVDWARASGAHKLALQVWPHNQAAIALYRGAGFVQEGLLRRHYPRRDGELWDAVVMGLLLDEASPGSAPS